jgi:allene oxide cyclase-like protein
MKNEPANFMMSQSLLTIKNILLSVAILGFSACTQETPQILVTIADARISPAQYSDIGDSGDSVGDILSFDQPLLDIDMREIGNNSGICTRTHIGHSFQCQWTLTFEDGSIQVAGREYDQGTSTLSIIGGTGKYSGINGEMESINNNDGTFTQTLHYWIRR